MPSNGVFVPEFCKTAEVRIENKKFLLPVRLTGAETPTERATNFYTTVAKLEQAAREISACARIAHLADNCNLGSVSEMNVDVLYAEYIDQLFDPASFRVISYHNAAGEARPATVTDADPQILKGEGDMITATVVADRREENLKFVTIQTQIDFSFITKDNKNKYDVVTVIELPMEDRAVTDAVEGNINTNTFQGKADIRTYTMEEFKEDILSETRQSRAASLKEPAFGTGLATLDTIKKDDLLKELFVDGCMKYLQDQIFSMSCPGLAYRPSNTLLDVKQIFQDDAGNPQRLSMNQFFIAMYGAAGSMSKKSFEVDLVTHAMDNMDPEVRVHVESTYTDHLKHRERDNVTQTRALQSLQKAAEASETQIMSLRRMVTKTTSSAMLGIPGYTARPTTGGNSTPALKSTAEQTIQNHTPAMSFIWKRGLCFGCGEEHKWMANGAIVCPNADRPGVRDVAHYNFKQLHANRSRRPYGDDSKTPSWDKMNTKVRRKFTRAVFANEESLTALKAHMAARKREAEEEPDEMEAFKRSNNNSTVMAVIPIFNAVAGSPPPIPVNLDGDLPHIVMRFGDTADDNLVTPVSALVDTGAGCTLGNLRFFQGLIAQNPAILVEVYTCEGGKYSPITMHGIVDPNAQGGIHTTQLPVAFRLRTCYTLRDGKELHIMVGLGFDVAVNFIISNAWLKKIGAVIDYGANSLRIPTHTDLKKFPIGYYQPRNTPPKITGGNLATHKAAFQSLPIMTNLLKVINAVDSASPYVGYFTKLIKTLEKSTLATIPALISIDDTGGRDGDITVTAATQRGPGPNIALDRPQVLNTNDNVGDRSAIENNSPKASTQVTFDSQLGEELCTHAHGQAAIGSTSQSSPDEDLFASSSEGESPVE